MQYILIPTDFSENAWNATTYAFEFFKDIKITFSFLHIDIVLKTDDDIALHYAGFTPKHTISKEITFKMQEWMLKVNNYLPNSNHHFKDTIIQAPFVEGIRKYIIKNQIQFLVMGTKGASGLKELTVGSKTAVVITRIKCPILIIPEATKFRKPVNIGFPTDFNMLYKNKVISTLKEVATTYQSSIKVLRVAQTHKALDTFQKSNRELLDKQIHAISHSFHVVESPNLEDGLQSFITTMHIDMVAIIAKNLNFFQRLFFKPHVAKISYHVHIPFLILHE